MNARLQVYPDALGRDLTDHRASLNQEIRPELMGQPPQVSEEKQQKLTGKIAKTYALIGAVCRDLIVVAEGMMTVRTQLARIVADFEDRTVHLEPWVR